jgi:3-hydroxyisobutyrate dehydrogenase-like beta-hydroxyacid dehydrogenase
MKVGFIGLGHMGAGMAGSLLKAGHEVVVFNRSPEKARPLADAGAKVARSVAEACEAGLVVTMLADDAAAEAVALGDDGLVTHLPKGGLHVSSSTIGVELSDRLAEAHARAGQAYVAAPVFGRPEAAAAAKLFVVAAGEPAAVERVRPVLDAVGQKTIVVSERPSAANLVKLAGNFMLASVIQSIGEAMALAEKGGVDRKLFLEVLTSTLFDVPVYRNYGGLIAERRFEPAGFAAPLGAKDVRLTLAAAQDLGVPMPFAGVLNERYLRLLATGGETLDWSALGGLAAKDAGLPD